MFFKKSEYKKLKEDLDEKLADFDTTGIFNLSRKELREKHQQLCAIRNDYQDRFNAFNKNHVKTLNKRMYVGMGSICGGMVPIVAAASAVDLIAFGGLATGMTMTVAGIVSVGDGIINIDKVRNLEKPLNTKIQTFKKALDIRKHLTKNKLAEKHTARKAFVVAERNKQQAKKIKELEKWAAQIPDHETLLREFKEQQEVIRHLEQKLEAVKQNGVKAPQVKKPIHKNNF